MFFLIFLGFLIGIISSIVSYFFLLVCIPITIFLFIRNGIKKTLIFLIFTIIGVLIFFLHPKGLSGDVEITGIVVKSSDNYFLLNSFKGKYYVSFDEYVPFGTILNIKGSSKVLNFSTYENAFDFRSYLNHRNVFYEIESTEVNFIFKFPPIIHSYRNWVLSYFSGDAKHMASQYLFSTGISNINAYSAYFSSGLSKFLSGAGLHISFLIYVIKKFFFRGRNQKVNYLISVLISCFFYIISLFKFSILRLVLKHVLKLIFFKSKKVDDFSINLICLIILLGLSPRMLLDPSIYFPMILILFNYLTGFYFNSFSKIKRRILKALFTFALLIPIYLISSNSIPLFSILFDYLLSIPSCVLFIMLLPVLLIPWVGVFLNPLFTIFISCLSYLLNIGNVYLGNVSGIIIGTYYALFFMYFVSHFYSLNKLKIVSLIFAFASIFVQPLDVFIPKSEIVFINVGQGDSTLIRTGYENILIDTGGLKNVNLATQALIPFFKQNRITKLDSVLITHNDFDHMGALEELNKNFNIKDIYYAEDIKPYKKICGINIQNLNESSSSISDNNDKSGVYYFEVNKNKILIMGDASMAVEKKIINTYQELDVDILKVGHHGSKYSSSFGFLKFVNPEIAVISVGGKNFYDHPSDEVLDKLESLNIPYRRTDLEGTIRIKL